MKRFVIADDHEVVRSGLRAIIESRPNWTVSGEAADGEQAIALLLKVRPDVGIVDYSMPAMNGVEVVRRMKSMQVRTEVLILTMHDDEELLTQAIMMGVRGILFKSDAGKYLVSAIESLLDGRAYFTGILLEKLLNDYQANKCNRSAAVLTSREQNIVQLIGEGHTNRSIGSILRISVKTVETHRASAMRKIGVSSTAELVRYGIRKRLVAP